MQDHANNLFDGGAAQIAALRIWWQRRRVLWTGALLLQAPLVATLLSLSPETVASGWTAFAALGWSLFASGALTALCGLGEGGAEFPRTALGALLHHPRRGSALAACLALGVAGAGYALAYPVGLLTHLVLWVAVPVALLDEQETGWVRRSAGLFIRHHAWLFAIAMACEAVCVSVLLLGVEIASDPIGRVAPVPLAMIIALAGATFTSLTAASSVATYRELARGAVRTWPSQPPQR